MTVPTATILLSQDKESISNVLQKIGSGTPIVNLIEQFSREEGVLLFSNHANPNFISFEHNFVGSNFEGKLEFIDPKNEFENNFLSTRSVFASLKQYLNKFKGQAPKTSKIEQKNIESAKKSTSKLPKPSSAEAADIVSANQKKNFYICFGIGDNIRYWSKVQRVELTGLVLDPSKSRKFTLKFAALSRPLAKLDRAGLYGENIDLNTLGNSTSVVGFGKQFNFYDYFLTGQMAYGESKANIYPVDLHSMVVDTIRSYVRKAALGANVIICLPDLNKLLNKRFKHIFSEAKSSPYNVENLKSALNSFLSDIGMSLDSATVYSARYPVEVTSMVEKVEASSPERVKYHFSQYSYYPTLTARSGEGIPDFMAPLIECLNKINNIAQESYTFTSVYVDETDTQVLDLWEDLNTYTFNGDEDFDADMPTVIIGDQSMISNHLYNNRADTDPISLHYTDSILKNAGYKKAIKDLVGSFDNEYVFGNLYKAPDEFGYLDAELFSEEQTKLIESEQIPVFKYNTKNPNVLDLQAIDNKTYFTNLNVAFSKNVDRVASTVREGGVNVALADFPITTREGLIQAIILSKYSEFGPTLSDKKIIDAVLKRISPELEAELELPPLVEDRVKVIKGFIDLISSNINNVTVHINQEINAAPAVLLDKFADFLTRVNRQATIKTLPFFNLSNRSLVNSSPCVLFAQDAPILSQIQKRTRFNNFLTGIYSIVGFRHVITQKDVYSEFSLTKVDIANTYAEKVSSPEEEATPTESSSEERETSMIVLPPMSRTRKLKDSTGTGGAPAYAPPAVTPPDPATVPYGGG